MHLSLAELLVFPPLAKSLHWGYSNWEVDRKLKNCPSFFERVYQKNIKVSVLTNKVSSVTLIEESKSLQIEKGKQLLHKSRKSNDF